MLDMTDVVLTVGRGAGRRVLLRGAGLRVREGETVVLSGLDPAARQAVVHLLNGRRRPRYGQVRRGDPAGLVLLDGGPRLVPEDLALATGAKPAAASLVVLADSVAATVRQRPGCRLLRLAGGRFVPATEPATEPSPEPGPEPAPRPVADPGTRMMGLDELTGRIRDALAAAGVPSAAAATVTRVLVDAERRGHRSHGVSLLPTYLRRIQAGGIDPVAEPALTVTYPGVASIDARCGPGQLAMELAAAWVAEEAARHGVATAAVHDNNHVGMMAAYREPFQRHGVIALLLNTSGPSVAAPGASRATLGSNAICLVTPTPASEPFCIDMATGVVAAGKIRAAAERNLPVPEGWLQDAEGHTTTDPARLDEGGSIPIFGDYKGLGVSLIVELLAGALAAGRVSPDVAKQRKRVADPMRCGQIVVGFSVAAFGPRPPIVELVDRLREAVRQGYPQGPPWPCFPDQLEEANAAVAERDGVPVARSVLAELGWDR